MSNDSVWASRRSVGLNIVLSSENFQAQGGVNMLENLESTIQIPVSNEKTTSRMSNMVKFGAHRPISLQLKIVTPFGPASQNAKA